MYYKTKGIVIHNTKYSENKIITKIFTEHYGLQAFSVNISKSLNSKFKANIIKPLAILDMEIFLKQNKEINSIKDCRNLYVYKTIPYDIIKSTMALFLAEVLYKALKVDGMNNVLFEFLISSFTKFDELVENYTNFHIYFILNLTKYLGFQPYNNYHENYYFDLNEGSYMASIPLHKYYLNQYQTKIFYLASLMSIDNLQFNFSLNDKRQLINNILSYYKIHIGSFKDVLSHKILEEIFKD
jgi:DNA repair protein RecO (recombination protein O)